MIIFTISLFTMATFAKQLSFFFVVISSTCYCQIQARESKFFSKYRHLSTTNYVTIPSTNPTLSSPSPSPSPVTSQISGIPASSPIGADSGSSPAPAPIIFGADYSPAPAPAGNDIPYYDEETNEEFSTENPEEEFNNRESYTFNSLSNNNGFWTSKNAYGDYKSEPQGMSDTRLHNDYHHLEKGNRNPTGYDYDGNYKKSKYEFDSMEEYENQEGIADFIPWSEFRL